MRDPRTDPRPGDVLNVYREEWLATFGFQVAAVGNGLVIYSVKGIHAEGKLTLDEWQNRMRDATIIHVAEEQECTLTDIS